MSTEATSDATPTERQYSFGPSALMTPANAVTMARLLATPAVIAMVSIGVAGWSSFVVAFAIGITDGLDGWLARRTGTTRSGAFLDPLADKVAVVGVLCALAGRGIVSWWPVALIAGRELAMSVYRSVLGRRGISIPARTSAKFKTFVQGVAILLCLSPPLRSHHQLLDASMWVAVAFTLFTFGQYLFDGRTMARRPTAPSGP